MSNELNYFIFRLKSKMGEWVSYCTELKSGTYSKEIKIFGNSMLLSNSVEYILKKYNDKMSSVCSKCPEFTLHTKGTLITKDQNAFIYNRNEHQKNNKTKQQCLIKVGYELAEQKWMIKNKKNIIYTKNNIKILNNCETFIDSIKTEGFFYRNSNTITNIDFFI